ncbi:MAG TPA: reverse transcriptase family protein [Candidatus Nitrosocosmicus sp.]|nr:reverse transcriptase family protein [Candidatus Nitrosocosmicus sp.]
MGLREITPTTATLQLADHSITYPKGVIEDVLVKVDQFIFPVDFIVLDMEEDKEIPIILGRPFLATGKAMIDVQKGELTMRVNDQTVTFNISRSMKYPAKGKDDECFRMDVIPHLSDCHFRTTYEKKDLENEQGEEQFQDEDIFKEDSNYVRESFEILDMIDKDKSFSPSIEKPPELELKVLPEHLKYAFLGDSSTLPVIISSKLTMEEEQKLMKILKNFKKAFGWTIADIKGISPSICMHRINLEENCKPKADPQRRLNPVMKEVVKKEILKWLDAGIIYPISDSAWVSPIHCVPKKGGVTVTMNEHNELIPTRQVTGWRICIDYRKLNLATRKDHFPLPFLDKMLDRLAGHKYFCFLDGYTGYHQVQISPEDQERTTFTSPYGTFAFRRMPFGLCNAPATFQRCMMIISYDLIDKGIEVFMDDLSVFGTSFDSYLEHLTKVRKHCEETNLVLNWEKMPIYGSRWYCIRSSNIRKWYGSRSC